jgi:REP element-mobilizing transposase RayT
MSYPPRIPVWLRWEQSVIYFVTICVAGRKPVLANDEALQALRVSARKMQNWTVLAAILMPDHLHVLVTPERKSRRQYRQLRGCIETLDAKGAASEMGMAAWFFRSLVA